MHIHTNKHTDTDIHIHIITYTYMNFSRRFRLEDRKTMWVKPSDWSKKLQHNYSNKDYSFLAQSSITQCNMYESQSVQQKCITNQMNREISNLRSCRTETGADWAKAQRHWQLFVLLQYTNKPRLFSVILFSFIFCSFTVAKFLTI